MKIILFSTPVMDYGEGTLKPIGYDASRECPPYGLYLLAAILAQEGHEVIVADLIAEGTNDIGRYVPHLEDCSLVGISATSLSWPAAVDVVSQIRESAPKVPIVLGGVHPSMFPEYVVRAFDVPFVLRGEAEISLPMLCNALERSFSFGGIPGLTWRSSDGRIISNPPQGRLTASLLSRSPVPDFSLLGEGLYKGLSIESSRGCRFNCSFCSATYRKNWVALPADPFVDNLERILEFTGKTTLGLVYVIDDHFSSNPQRCIEIASRLRERELRPRLTYDSRVNDLLADGFLESMVEFTYQILVGAECGYDEGLKRIGKGTCRRDIEEAAAKLAECGLAPKTDFSFIVGLPWETTAEVQRTLRFAGYLLAEYGVRVLVQWYVQMPGSRLWLDYRKRQIVHEAMYDRYGFFRNLYLFRSGNALLPSEIWEVARAVEAAKVLSRLRYPEKQMIEHALPLQIHENFPEGGLESFDCP